MALLIVVNPDPEALAAQLVCFQQAGCVGAGTTSFADARALIAAFRPDVLVTTVRIGGYNGIHLALLAHTKHGDLPTIVLGNADHVLEREAEHAGAQYVIAPTDPTELVALVRRAANGEEPARRWTRVRPLADVNAVADGHPAHVVDISYGGIGLAVPREDAGRLPEEVQVALPELGVTVTAQRVWSRTEADHVRYGLRLPAITPDGVASWRAIVETMRGVTANN